MARSDSQPVTNRPRVDGGPPASDAKPGGADRRGPPDAGLYVGVDVGGTKVEAALVDAEGRPLAVERRATRPEHGVDAVLARLVECVDAVRASSASNQLRGVGVGVAGQVDHRTGTVRFAPNLGWHDVALGPSLRGALDLPVFVLNDVQAATFGEWRHGAGIGVDDLVCLFLGTGVGGGIVGGGELLLGCLGSAGELGHTVVDLRGGRRCRCGGIGCLETLAGGWAIAERARELARDGGEPGRSLTAAAGGVAEQLTAEQVITAARSGNAVARQVLADAAAALGAAAISLVNAFNPCVLVIGGGIVAGAPELIDVARDAVVRLALPTGSAAVRIVPPGLARHAGSVGAAAWARWRMNARPSSGKPGAARTPPDRQRDQDDVTRTT